MEKDYKNRIILDKHPKVSIVVPVYNVEEFLEKCLDSILNQTYQNYELILINDGSTDNSGCICDEYEKKDSRIKVIHQLNEGQSAARNKGVSVANSDWIMFIDSDDIIHHKLLEFLVNAVLHSNANVGTCLRFEGSKLPEKFYTSNMCEYQVIDINEQVLIELYNAKSDIYWALFPSLIKKEIVEKRKFTCGRIYEDNALSCQWLYEAKRIVLIPLELYFYRDNPHGTMRKPFSKKKLDYLWALKEQILFYETVNYESLIDIISREYIRTTVWMCDRIQRELNDNQLRIETLKNTKKTCKMYRKYIQNYSDEMELINKILYPKWHKVKKRLGLYREISKSGIAK